MIKALTIIGVIVGIIAGGITMAGTIQGQPDLLGQYAVQISEILDIGIDLLKQCQEECFSPAPNPYLPLIINLISASLTV